MVLWLLKTLTAFFDTIDYQKKLFSSIPKRGDIVVFKTPQDNRTDYIKRVIGLPGR